LYCSIRHEISVDARPSLHHQRFPEHVGGQGIPMPCGSLVYPRSTTTGVAEASSGPSTRRLILQLYGSTTVPWGTTSRTQASRYPSLFRPQPLVSGRGRRRASSFTSSPSASSTSRTTTGQQTSTGDPAKAKSTGGRSWWPSEIRATIGSSRC
jgi:hypothetical protein